MNEEKVIIRGTKYQPKDILKVCMGIAVAIAILLTLILYLTIYLPDYNNRYLHHTEFGSKYCWNCFGALSAKECAKNGVDGGFIWFTLLMPLAVGYIISGVFSHIISSIEITVTTKRVYGAVGFGRRRVDLPLDSISSIGSSWLKGVAVATSSGKISFILLKNAKQIHKEIATLLINRQNTKAQEKPVLVSNSNADELKKYKELLDCGVITQEEFDAKKKQLLGL